MLARSAHGLGPRQRLQQHSATPSFGILSLSYPAGLSPAAPVHTVSRTPSV